MFSVSKIWFQSSHLGLEFQNTTLYNFSKVLLTWDIQSKPLHVFCCQHKKFPCGQQAGSCIEKVVATTCFNEHLPCLIATAYKPSIWDQNGEKKKLDYVPTLHDQSFFHSCNDESWLLAMASDKMLKRSTNTLKDGETEAQWNWVFRGPHRLMEDLRTALV